MAHPFKSKAEASDKAKRAAMGVNDKKTIYPGVQTVNQTCEGSGQTSETQRVPTRKTGGRVGGDGDMDCDDGPRAKKRLDRPGAYARGGAVKKGGTTVNVVVAGGAGAQPPAPPMLPPPDMGPPMPPPGPMPMGPPPGMPMRAHGGRVGKKVSPQGKAGAGSGVGRLNKAKAEKCD